MFLNILSSFLENIKTIEPLCFNVTQHFKESTISSHRFVRTRTSYIILEKRKKSFFERLYIQKENWYLPSLKNLRKCNEKMGIYKFVYVVKYIYRYFLFFILREKWIWYYKIITTITLIKLCKEKKINLILILFPIFEKKRKIEIFTRRCHQIT